MQFVCIYMLNGSMKRIIPLTDWYSLEKTHIDSCFQEKSLLTMEFLMLKDSALLKANVNFQHIHPNSAVPTDLCSVGQRCI